MLGLGQEVVMAARGKVAQPAVKRPRRRGAAA
jgi:hypothetical protein